MCTVSFVAHADSFIITSNRDEHIARPLAYEPREEIINKRKIIYPKDPKAGGSWFALNEDHVTTVLLNGAFRRHKSNGNYRKSRGLILLDIVSSSRPKDQLRTIKLTDIEPFTMVFWQEPILIEFRWDGRRRYIKELNPTAYHIWSSTTLYSPEVIEYRSDLFNQFMKLPGEKNDQKLFEFHSGNSKDQENGFVINRKSGLKTFSITQAVIREEKATLMHKDLLNNKDHLLTINSNKLLNQI